MAPLSYRPARQAAVLRIAVSRPARGDSAAPHRIRPTAVLHSLGDEFHMSKVVQVRAAIARHRSAVPTHLDLMGSDPGDRAQSGGLVAVLPDPDDAVA